MLTNQQIFIRRKQRYQNKIIFLRWFLLLFFLLSWEVSVKCGILDDFIFSSPSRIIHAFFQMFVKNELYRHIFITLMETLISFAVVMIFSIIVAILLWFCHTFYDILEPYLVTLNSLPKSALAPVLIVWLGTGYKAIIITAVSVSIFGTILSIYTSFTETDPEKIKLIRTLGGNRYQILTKLILPESLTTLISCMKVNIGLCLVGVIIAEFLVAKVGLGYVIIYNSQIFKMDLVLLSICILCILAALLYKGIHLLEKHFLRSNNK